MGLLDPARFAGGRVTLEPGLAQAAVRRSVGSPLSLDTSMAALAIGEIVTENMANAARVHAVELGKTVEDYTVIAFGGAAPLHAARLADKLGVRRVVIPVSASVGSALGFLTAPVAFQSLRSWYQRVAGLDVARANRLLEDMTRQATGVVRDAAPRAALVSHRVAYMRYAGQGHEIAVTLPAGTLTPRDIGRLGRLFDDAYRALYGRTVPNMDVEIMSWSVTVSTKLRRATAAKAVPKRTIRPAAMRRVFEPTLARWKTVPVVERGAMPPGARILGPALIVEDQTTVVVTADFEASINALGFIVLDKRRPAGLQRKGH
jgi:N-methylhydantoinase A